MKLLFTLEKKIVAAIIMLLIQFQAISQSNPLFNYIPTEATSVIHADILRMYQKSSAADLQNSFLYKLLNQHGETAGEFFKNPAKTGIDFSAGIVVVMAAKENFFPRNRPTIYFKLKDPAAFTAFMQQMHTQKHGEVSGEEENIIRQYGTDHIILSEYKMSAGWNNEVAVFTELPGEYDYTDVTHVEAVVDTVTTYETDSAIVAPDTAVMTFNTISLAEQRKQRAMAEQKNRQLLFDLLTPRYSDFFANNEFRDMLQQPADIRVWSTGGVKKPFSKIYDPLLRVSNIGKNKSTSLFNFEKGRIVMLSKSYPSESIKELYKGFQVSPQNGELLRKLSPGNVIGLMSVTADRKMVDGLLNFPGFKKSFEEMSNVIPIKLDPSAIAAAFKTNMLMALLRNEGETIEPIARKLGGFEFLIAVPIADKAKFDAIKMQLMPLLDSLKKETPEKFEHAPVLKFNDEMMVIALTSKTADAFLYNPAPGEAPSWIHEFSQYPVVMNFNFKKLFTILISKGKSETEKEEMKTVMDTFDQVYLYGGNYNNGAVEMNMEFRFADKEVNALGQFIKLLSTIK